MVKSLLVGSLLLACTGVALAQEEGKPKEKATYARPELLVAVDSIADQLATDKAPLLLDARSKEEYAKGHLPGAVWVDVDEWKKAFGDGTDKLGWSKRIGTLGIDGKSPVVVYDGGLTPSAARVWWILTYWGVEEASLLNGGMKAWQAAEHPTVSDVAEITAKPFKAAPQKDRLVTHEELKKVLSDGDPFKLFDVRTVEEHEGGRIATCTHLDWQDLVDKETGKMLPAAELKKLFDKAGYDPKKPAVTYCQSGGRASVMAFALELMGGKEVANYYGSWGEWSQKELSPADDSSAEK